MPLDTNASTEAAIAQLIVETLSLEVSPDQIVPTERLFGEGLGLDSIDALELALALSRSYGVELKSDNPDISKIFASLRSLAAHVDATRTR
jgi:acyl carrier protein